MRIGQLHQQVRGEDLRERAEPQKRIRRRRLLTAGPRLAVPAEEDLVSANQDQHHAGLERALEEVCTDSVGSLQRRKDSCPICVLRRSADAQGGEPKDLKKSAHAG